MKTLVKTLILTFLMSACIPDSVREKMNESMDDAQQMLADWEFKKAIAHIELHKLRNGIYPNSLSELQFLTQMDSSMFSYVEYTRLESMLNYSHRFFSINFQDVNAGGKTG
jgi:hypothetical protein